MIYSQVAKISAEIARQSLIDYTREELLTPEQAKILKRCIIQNVEICLSPLAVEDDLVP